MRILFGSTRVPDFVPRCELESSGFGLEERFAISPAWVCGYLDVVCGVRGD